MPVNRQVQLKSRPKGMPKESDFELVETGMPEPGPGQVLIRNRLLSLDPYMRGQMDEGESYTAPIDVGAVMGGHTIGEVLESRAEGFAPGDLVWANGGWQDFAIPSSLPPARKVDSRLAPLGAWLGPLGLPGWTAHVGLLELGEPKPGETIVVTAASGAVGRLVGQLAKAAGLRVVGVAGGAAKCAYATAELGYDACVDYKRPDFSEALAAACPKGIDIDFENVGGEVLATIWPLLNPHARVVVSGLIAQYSLTSPFPGPELTLLLKRRLRIRGFIISDHAARFPSVIADMAGRLKAGTLKTREDLTMGLENAPSAFLGMLQGKNFGKTLVEVA
jgi:NADPH-dependent curcumin reductase